MLIQSDIHKALNQLNSGDTAKLTCKGLDIAMRYIDDASKLAVSTPIYFGGNYIPGSVRNSLSHSHFTSRSNLKTYLTIDEQHFQVNLNCLDQTENLNHSKLEKLLEDFGYLATKWRTYLDGQDKRDLIYIKVR